MGQSLRGPALVAMVAIAACAWAGAPRDYQRSTAANGDYAIKASYVNFNRDPLEIAFPLAIKAVRDSSAEFGFAQSETKAMAQACNCSQQEFDRKVDGYYHDRAVGSRMDGGVRHLYVDVPQVVSRNRPRLRQLAAEFDKMTSARHYNQDDSLGAMITFVQAALNYDKPPDQENGRETLGFFPPLRALEAGFGDCDTKSALLAAILTNFPGVKMIGIHVPRHYLVGIARVPRQGDAFIEYKGEPFVLIEASGPGRLPPGSIGPTTQAALATMNEVRIDPLF